MWPIDQLSRGKGKGKVTSLMQLIFQLSWLRFYCNKVGSFITTVKCARGSGEGKPSEAGKEYRVRGITTWGKSTAIEFFFFHFANCFLPAAQCPNEFSILSRVCVCVGGNRE